MISFEYYLFKVVLVVVFSLDGALYFETPHKCSQLLLVRIFLTLHFEIIIDAQEVANVKHIVPCTLYLFIIPSMVLYNTFQR